ncbi:unnamed protein product [Phyllotreta striolata]|uniref:Protein zwilch n=1 Tax=Phyllotreta striolata TaxID=444603 RepID=A0A9N9TM29_PHYSR|nr:unnamed protein product [Phyllotreta striolata]
MGHENNQFEDVVEAVDVPPSYLLDFILDKNFEKIMLAHLRKTRKNCEKSYLNESTIEITGNPLEVDLQGNASFLLETEEGIINQWLESENEHTPMDIRKARKYLNFKTNMRNKEAVFAVCDGNNPRKTIVVGFKEQSKKIFTCTLNVIGFMPITHENLLFSSMKRGHYVLCGTMNCYINYSITFKYMVYGSFLQNLLRNNSKQYGIVSIENNATSECELSNPSNLKNEMKLSLDLIPGHKESSVHFLWQELCLLQNLINIIDRKEINIDSVISSQPLSLNEIYDNIQQIIKDRIVKKISTEFNLIEMRELNIMDKLWNILKRCGHLEDVKSALVHFLMKLSGYDNIPTIIGKTRAARILDCLLNGRILQINNEIALELLFGLGTEKLKNDYEAICKHFFIPSYNHISSKWNKMTREELIDADTKFHSWQFLQVDVWRDQLNYLGTLHLVTEYIYLVKNNAYVPDTPFNSFCSKIIQEYVSKERLSTIPFSHLQDIPSTHLEITIPHVFETNNLPDFYAVKLNSVTKGSEIESVYVLSKYSIIPPVIYNNYDRIVENDYYYSYVFESVTETCEAF